MNPVWHPWLGEVRLGLGRMDFATIRRVPGVPVLLPTAAVAVAVAALYSSSLDWLPPCAGMLLVAGYAVARHRLVSLSTTWRDGWWGAAPLARGVATRTLWLLLGVATLAVWLPAALLAWAWSNVAPQPSHLRPALLALTLAIGGGALLAGIAASYRRRPHRVHAGIHVPLLPMSWPDDFRLPHLCDWQRREALARWRGGGHFALIGVALAMLPIGAPLSSVIGIGLLAAALAWLTLVLRACADVAVEAGDLLRATAVDPGRMQRVPWRYPAFATLCAMIAMLVGVVLLGASVLIACGWLTCAAVISAPSLHRLATHSRHAGAPS